MPCVSARRKECSDVPYGKHPFYISDKEMQDETYDRDMNGQRVDARIGEAMARYPDYSYDNRPKKQD
jgi:hypothetical protein